MQNVYSKTVHYFLVEEYLNNRVCENIRWLISDGWLAEWLTIRLLNRLSVYLVCIADCLCSRLVSQTLEISRLDSRLVSWIFSTRARWINKWFLYNYGFLNLFYHGGRFYKRRLFVRKPSEINNLPSSGQFGFRVAEKAKKKPII